MRELNTKTNKWVMERLVPDLVPWYSRQTVADHKARYDFASQFVAGKTVLDIACGSGYGSHLLAQSGAKQVIGVDVCEQTIKYAQKRYAHNNVKLIKGDAVDIPLSDNSVDVVVSFETLEHVQNYQQFIIEINRVLKRHGTCLISTPNDKLNDETCNEFHLHQFSRDQFTTILNKHFAKIELFGQKPMHGVYLNIVRKITSHISKGFVQWFVDSGLKCMFRGVDIKPIDTFRFGFIPAFFIAKGYKK